MAFEMYSDVISPATSPKAGSVPAMLEPSLIVTLCRACPRTGTRSSSST